MGDYQLQELWVVKDDGGGVGMVYGGNVVEAVAAGSPAARAGVRKGMVICEVAGQPVNDNTTSVAAALAAAKREFSVIVEVEEPLSQQDDPENSPRSVTTQPSAPYPISSITATTQPSRPSLRTNSHRQSRYTAPASSSVPKGEAPGTERSPPAAAPTQRLTTRQKLSIVSSAARPMRPHNTAVDAAEAEAEAAAAQPVHVDGLPRVQSIYTERTRTRDGDLSDSLHNARPEIARSPPGPQPGGATPPGTPTAGWGGRVGPRRESSRYLSPDEGRQSGQERPPLRQDTAPVLPAETRPGGPSKGGQTVAVDAEAMHALHISPKRPVTTPNVHVLASEEAATRGAGTGGGGPRSAGQALPATPQQSRYNAALERGTPRGSSSRVLRQPLSSRSPAKARSRGHSGGDLAVGPSRTPQGAFLSVPVPARAGESGMDHSALSVMSGMSGMSVRAKQPSKQIYVDEDGYVRDGASPRRGDHNTVRKQLSTTHPVGLDRDGSYYIPPSRRSPPSSERLHPHADPSHAAPLPAMSSAPLKSSRPSVSALEEDEPAADGMAFPPKSSPMHRGATPTASKMVSYAEADRKRVHALSSLDDDDFDAVSHPSPAQLPSVAVDGAAELSLFERIDRAEELQEDTAAKVDDLEQLATEHLNGVADLLQQKCRELADRNGALHEDVRAAHTAVATLEARLASVTEELAATKREQALTNQRLQAQIDALTSRVNGPAGADAAAGLADGTNGAVVAAIAQAVSQQLSAVLPSMVHGDAAAAQSPLQLAAAPPPQRQRGLAAPVPSLISPRQAPAALQFPPHAVNYGAGSASSPPAVPAAAQQGTRAISPHRQLDPAPQPEPQQHPPTAPPSEGQFSLVPQQANVVLPAQPATMLPTSQPPLPVPYPTQVRPRPSSPQQPQPLQQQVRFSQPAARQYAGVY